MKKIFLFGVFVFIILLLLLLLLLLLVDFCSGVWQFAAFGSFESKEEESRQV